MGAVNPMKTKSKPKKVKMSEQDKHSNGPDKKEEAKTEPVKKETPQHPAVSEGNIKAGIVIS